MGSKDELNQHESEKNEKIYFESISHEMVHLEKKEYYFQLNIISATTFAVDPSQWATTFAVDASQWVRKKFGATKAYRCSE